jgi:hypothetical protein
MYQYDEKKKKLYPFTPYYPIDLTDGNSFKYGSLWKGIELSKGIVGKTAREVIAHIYKIKNCSDCSQELISDWGFTKEEVSRMRSDRKSYAAYPVVNNRKAVRGVIYLDSDNSAGFDTFNFNVFDQSRQYLSMLLKKDN